MHDGGMPYGYPTYLIESIFYITASSANRIDSSDHVPLLPYVFFPKVIGARFVGAWPSSLDLRGSILIRFGTCTLVLTCCCGCRIGCLGI